MSTKDLTVKMMPEHWARVQELCKKLNLDPWSFSQCRMGGKLSFDLQRAVFQRSFLEEITPERYRNE